MPKKKKPARKGFSAEERAAMREYVRELKGVVKTEGESVVLAKIAAMPEPDRGLGKRLHAIIRANAPGLSPKLWYGMPAYARDEKVVCWFQPAHKFKTRYGMLGFSDKANLDDGAVWPVAYALMKLTGAEEAKVAALVRQAAQ